MSDDGSADSVQFTQSLNVRQSKFATLTFLLLLLEAVCNLFLHWHQLYTPFVLVVTVSISTLSRLPQNHMAGKKINIIL